MPIENVFRASPDLGPGITDKITLDAHYDVIGLDSPSYQVGTQVTGSDGGEYWFVKASANIASTANTGTQVVITFPAYTVATGTGGFYTQPGVAVTAGEFIHVRKGAWNAAPA